MAPLAQGTVEAGEDPNDRLETSSAAGFSQLAAAALAMFRLPERRAVSGILWKTKTESVLESGFPRHIWLIRGRIIMKSMQDQKRKKWRGNRHSLRRTGSVELEAVLITGLMFPLAVALYYIAIRAFSMLCKMITAILEWPFL
jgi:hypothetical protein